MNRLLNEISSYTSKEMARALDSDPSAVNLSIGEPHYGPPPYLMARMADAVSEATLTAALTRYETTRGSMSLRSVISDYYRTEYQLATNAETEIAVTHGGVGALLSALLAISEPGDSIAIPDPSYMLYERLVRLLGRSVVRISRSATNGFQYDLDSCRQAMRRGAKALIINSPENPTGYVCTEAELRQLKNICRESGAWLIHDEVYDQLAFGRIAHRPALVAPAGDENVILVNSFSKKFGVPGLRLGWMVAPSQVISLASKAHDYCVLAVNRLSEGIGEVLLSDPSRNAWLSDVRRDLREAAGLTVKTLESIEGLTVPSKPEGGLFVFAHVGGISKRLGLHPNPNAGDAFSRWLLENFCVAVVPGGIYGTNCGSFIRIVYSVRTEKLKQGLSRLSSLSSLAALTVREVNSVA